MGKMPVFAQREVSFWAFDGQKGGFCPSGGVFPGVGWAKRPILPNGKRPGGNSGALMVLEHGDAPWRDR